MLPTRGRNFVGFLAINSGKPKLWETSRSILSFFFPHLEVAVPGHEEEVVVDELLADGLVHAGQGVVGAGQVGGQLGEGVLHQVLDADALVLGDAWGEAEAVNVAAHPDPGRVDRHLGGDVAVDLGGVHVGGVLGVGLDAVVLLDDGVKDVGKVLVRVPVAGVDAAVLVVELDGARDGLGEGEAASLGADVLVLVPSLLGHVLGDQGVGGLDVGKLSGHVGLICFGPGGTVRARFIGVFFYFILFLIAPLRLL